MTKRKDGTITVLSSKIYKAKRGCIYDDDKPRYKYYIPRWSGSYWIVDCWVVDINGKIHPGYNVSPVPVLTSWLGKVVGDSPYGDN